MNQKEIDCHRAEVEKIITNALNEHLDKIYKSNDPLILHYDPKALATAATVGLTKLLQDKFS